MAGVGFGVLRFELPEVWSNDDAMFALMQPIRRSRSVDPAGYYSKVNFWKSLLLSYAQHQNVLVMSKRSSQGVFTRNFPEEDVILVPQCMDEVFSELIIDGEIREHVPYKGVVKSVLQLAVTLFQKPLQWSVQALTGGDFSYLTESSSDNQNFVFHKVAEFAARKFLLWFQDKHCEDKLTPHSAIYEHQVFCAAMESFIPHALSRDYMCELLEHTYKCVSVEDVSVPGNSKVVRIVRIADDIFSVPVKPTNSEELRAEEAALAGIINIKSTIKWLEKEEGTLQMTIDQRFIQIKQLLSSKKTEAAKMLLRRTKMLQKTLERKQSQIDNLVALQLDIQSATENKLILKTLASANLAAKQAIGDVDAAENIVNDTLDVMQDNQELTNMIMSVGECTSFCEAEDADLMLELDSLLIPDVDHDKAVDNNLSEPSFIDNKLSEELAQLALLSDKLSDASESNANKQLLMSTQ